MTICLLRVEEDCDGQPAYESVASNGFEEFRSMLLLAASYTLKLCVRNKRLTADKKQPRGQRVRML